MPKPPRPDAVDKISFITNYYIQGCQAPYSVWVEFSHDPIENLFLLFLAPDMTDIVKEWLRPSGGRQRRPGRHGRKSGRQQLSLDPNEMVSSYPRAGAPEYPGIKFPGAKAVFYLSDEIDKVNWSAAVVEGVSGAVFDVLWGVISVRPDLCPHMGWLDAGHFTDEAIVGSAPPTLPFGYTKIYSVQDFTPPNPWAFASPFGPAAVTYTANVRCATTNPIENFFFTLRNEAGEELARSGRADIEPGSNVDLTLSGELPMAEFGTICRTVDFGSALVSKSRLFCFTKKDLL